ncbi:ATP-dependent RNA helicase TDRD12, partial [Brachionus plicatilis]
EIIASFDLNESVDQNSTEATKETVNKALTNSTNSSHPVATKAAVNKTLTNSAKSSRPKGSIEVPHDPTINIFTAQSVCLSSNHVESARNMQEITPTANVMSSPVVSPDVSMNRSAFSSLDRTKFWYTNATSLNNKMHMLESTAFSLEPDIIGITDTWFCPSSVPELIGYQLFRVDRLGDVRGG